jgi:hypothetical protein
MLLVLTSTNGQGQALSLLNGPVVPEWGGDQAGRPGQAFAKVLRDVETGAYPVVNYWKQTLIVSDNRIPAMGSDISVYLFAAPEAGSPVTVTAELRFRRLFQAEAEARGWQRPDVVMETAQSKLPSVEPWWSLFLPLVFR